MADGWIKLHRQIQDNTIWNSEPFSRGQAWVDLILLANHKPSTIYVRDHKISIDRGQVGWSENRLSARWQWSRTKVRKFLKDLEKEQQIKIHKSKSYTVLTIVNYDFYQQEEQQKDNSSTTEIQQKDTNKNVKNVKNVNISPLIEGLSSVKKMQEPLTVEQGEELVNEYGFELVSDTLLAMENYKPLLKKNKSTHLTCRNWMRRYNNSRKQKNNGFSYDDSHRIYGRHDEVFK